MNLRPWFLAAVLLSTPAQGQERQFKNGEAVALEPGLAYVLARTFESQGGGLAGTVRIVPILARLLSEEELRQAAALRQSDPDRWKKKIPPNVVAMLAEQPYMQAGGESVLLTAMKPGTYILSGIALQSWATRGKGEMVSSLCMGTVKFEAKAGVITDLGEILAAREDQPTAIPELADVTGKGVLAVGILPYAVAVRPANASMLAPSALVGLPRVPANYRAMPAYPNYPGTHLNRLAPVSGVLDYDKDGQVVDLKEQGPHAP